MITAADFIFSHTRLHAKFIKRLDGGMSLHGISFSEYMILHYLGTTSGEAMRRIDLAEAIGISASGVTRMLAPMEKIGLVEKEINPRDARVSLVRLSKAGGKIYQEASATLDLHAATLAEPLTEIQMNKAMKYVSKLLGLAPRLGNG